MSALKMGRAPVVLAEHKNHARLFAERLGCFTCNVLLLTSGLGCVGAVKSQSVSRQFPGPGNGFRPQPAAISARDSTTRRRAARCRCNAVEGFMMSYIKTCPGWGLPYLKPMPGSAFV